MNLFVLIAANVIPALIAWWMATDSKAEVGIRITIFAICAGWLIWLGYYVASIAPVGNTLNPNNLHYSYWWPHYVVLPVVVLGTIVGFVNWSKQAMENARHRPAPPAPPRAPVIAPQAVELSAWDKMMETFPVNKQAIADLYLTKSRWNLVSSEISEIHRADGEEDAETRKENKKHRDEMKGLYSDERVNILGDTRKFSELWEATRPSASTQLTTISSVKEIGWEPKDFRSVVVEDAERLLPKKTMIYEPIEIPDERRFEHQLILAPSGSGKTTLLENLMNVDFERVARGECSVVLIDSENEIIPELARLAIFGPGGKLEGKLVILEADAEYPLALNLFDVPKLSGSLNEIREAQKEIRENILDCISAVNEAQEDLLVFLIELCLVIPDATLNTLLELLMPGGLGKYAEYLDDLDDVAQGYFRSTFLAKTSLPTQEALMRRLRGMLRESTLRDMFLQDRSKFDIGNEVAQGKVILINTKRRLLGDDGCQMLGRFFLSQLMQAAMARGKSSLPVFCYVDECQNYISTYERMGKFLGEARKRRIGMTFITLDQSRIKSPAVWDSLMESAIIFNTTGKERQRGQFQLFVRFKYFDPPITVQVPPPAERVVMRDADYNAILSQMRARYCAPTQAGALTIYQRFRDTPPPNRPTPPAGRVFDAEWWEENDEPPEPSKAMVYAPRLLPKPDEIPEVPQPGRRRRRR